jgi:hypothetical protein
MECSVRLMIPGFASSCHVVGVDDGRDGNGSRQERWSLLDIPRWGGDEAGTPRRSTGRGLERRSAW